MLCGLGRKRITSCILVALLMICTNLNYISVNGVKEPFFTLILKMRDHDIYGSMALEMALMLKEIGINLQVIFLGWVEYIQELTVYKDYDIFIFSTTTNPENPDMSKFFGEGGTLNFVNYATQLDYNSSLGMGENQWYLEEGKKYVPPNSEEQIQHYWRWQEYLMSKINPALFALTPQCYIAHWAELEGYDITEGLLQSWGKMSWKTAHINQTSQEELAIRDAIWENLNPLLQESSNEEFISEAILDPLVWCGTDNKIYPHIATTWVHINDTHVRVNIREGIPWQIDLEGNFTNEYLTAEDVYFTFYCWKNLSNKQEQYQWINDMKIIDNSTIDFFIDGNPETPENDYYPQYLNSLTKGILPEHYLNQTQMSDRRTPDMNHRSWFLYNYNKTFGTGMFEFDSFNENSNSLATGETILTLNTNCWLFNESIEKSDLDLEERFGTKWSLTKLKIKYYDTHLDSAFDFVWGNIDLIDVTSYPENRTSFQKDSTYTVQNKDTELFSFIGYNLAPNRPWIGNQEPCPNDPSMTIGLAVRKAISHAIDRVKINTNVYGGEYSVNDYPMSPMAGIWLNPDIYRYSFDLTKAQEYMTKAGFSWSSTAINGANQNWYVIFSSVAILILTQLIRKKTLQKVK